METKTDKGTPMHPDTVERLRDYAHDLLRLTATDTDENATPGLLSLEVAEVLDRLHEMNEDFDALDEKGITR